MTQSAASHSDAEIPPPAESSAVPSSDGSPEFVTQRLRSLDAYRGLVMILLACVAFGLRETAVLHLETQPDSTFWSVIEFQFSHVQWVGCTIWDMLQPSFMFMVGVAMAYSYAKRKRLGQSYPRMLGHAAWRSVVLVFLGIFLMSNGKPHTNWSLVNVLTQIGLGYTFLFLLWGRGFRVQAVAAAAVLVGTWLLFVCYPGAGIDLETGAMGVGVEPEFAQEYLVGVSSPWHKNANVGHAIDVWLFSLLPQQPPFEFNKGGYQTINFIPSLATMLFGLMCGELLRSSRSMKWKLAVLVVAGLSGLLVGQILSLTGICPIVKRIWTPSWAIFSTGWCCLILAALFSVIDMLNYRRWAFPLVVVGMNSIAVYCMGMLLRPWTARTWQTHLGADVFLAFGDAFEPMLRNTMTGLFFWLACLWLYRQKVFFRI